AAATGKKPAIVDSEAVLTFVTSSPSQSAPAPPASSRSSEAPPPAPAPPSSDAPPPSDSAAPADDNTPLFTLRDRRTIRTCVNEHASDLARATEQLRRASCR